ncbi:glycine zipper 2TM domain-containing protein [Phenylobacterium terrae]|uniref:17 kDa surface antigen n=1 Tax=Phenylobacterium terrae TaxID=2665495 RepID=A0ABW4N5D6_9CAUL
MTFRSTLAKSALAAVAGVAAMTAVAAPSVASAQTYGGAYYDPCRREQTNRGTVGGLIGGALGAAIGSNAAARKNRTEGALLGGALGAVAGAAVGNNSAACRSGYPQDSYYGYDRGYSSGYYNQPYALEDRYRSNGYYGGGYYGSAYEDDYDGYAYGYGGERLRITQRAGADGCALAESPVYMPDGRTVTRMVRVCRDSRGRYQVVD